MTRSTRSQDQFDGDREAAILAGVLGREVKRARRLRHLTQRQLAARVGLEQSRMSEIELGGGTTLPLRSWVRLGLAIDRPFAALFSRELAPEPRDAGHLAAQELVLRIARGTGRTGLFELPTRPADSSRSTDIGLRDDRHRVLIRIEIWNRLDDLGAAIRACDRKDAEAAVQARFAEPPYRTAACWLLVDTLANRGLVHRYPEILRVRFRGSSRAWAGAITGGGAPPIEPGLCWVDPRAGLVRAPVLPCR